MPAAAGRSGTLIFFRFTKENANRVRSPSIDAEPAPTGVSHILCCDQGLEPEVRVRGAKGALPVADEATRASGSGLYFQGGFDRRRKYRAPQQGSDATAAGGGKREQSEWPRSIKSRKSVSPKILLGTATGGIGRHQGLRILPKEVPTII